MMLFPPFLDAKQLLGGREPPERPPVVNRSRFAAQVLSQARSPAFLAAAERTKLKDELF
jgi:N-acyl-L-homoserine lactone synthetase